MSELQLTTEKFQEIAPNMSKTLESNKTRASKGVAYGKSILSEIQDKGMSAEMDEKCNKYLVLCRTAVKEMQEERKPFTVFLDTIKKEFTAAENFLDVTKQGTEAFQIQIHRNEFVTQLKKEEAQKKKEAAAKLAKDQEAIDNRTVFESQLSKYLQNYIASQKISLQNSFNAITLDNFNDKSEKLKALKAKYPKEHFDKFSPFFTNEYHSKEELVQIQNEMFKKQDLNILAGVVEGEINAFIKELIDKLPSLKLELERIAKAGEEEKKRLELEKVAREAKEKADAEAKAKLDAEKKEAELQAQNMAQKTEAMMNNEVELFESSAESPEVRTGFKINILHHAGAMEIIAFWFENEGKNLTITELEKKSILQMKAFCEKMAFKIGEKIESKYLSYVPVYKAVNKK